jgi:hypothetical protein
MCAGAAPRELDKTDLWGARNVGRVEFTDSAHGQASQGTRLIGMGRSPFRIDEDGAGTLCAAH